MDDDQRRGELAALAQDLGIDLGYWDVEGTYHDASADGIMAAAGAMGLAVDGLGSVPDVRRAWREQHDGWVLPPVLVAWIGHRCTFEVRAPARASVDRLTAVVLLEAGGELVLGDVTVEEVPPSAAMGREGPSGSVRVLRVSTGPIEAPPGHHEISVSAGGLEPQMRPLVLAPRRVPAPAFDDRQWGVFSPVYALAGGTGLGAHVGDLGALAAAIDAQGGKLVGTLPVLASWLSEPFDPSPYAPVSRRFWNELYVDLAALPELAALPAAAADLAGLRSIGHAANEKTRSFDYRHQYGFVRGVLEHVVAGRASWPVAATEAYLAYVEQHPDAAEYALFRAYAEAKQSGWHDWPEPQRSGSISPTDVDPAVYELHLYGQYAMRRDLVHLDAQLQGRDQHLYLDLPVGAHGDGFDTWKHRELFAWGAAAGAPPDGFFTGGQNWGFPPLRPWASRVEGHRHFRDVLAHHMEVCGILRLDHVMGLHRMFWVPDGMSAHEGVYVQYPREELLAVLAVEAHRHDCLVVGEDLGTVPDEIRDAMDDHGLLGMYVAQFHQPAWAGAELDAPSPEQLATIDTHDTPTFAGWVHGLDIDRRHVLGLLDDDAAEQERAERRQQVANVHGFLQARGDLPRGSDPHDDPALLQGLLRFLGESEAPLLLVALDDLMGERNPQNVPGTMIDRPNWVQRVPRTIAELMADEQVLALVTALQECRLGAHLRARGDES